MCNGADHDVTCCNFMLEALAHGVDNDMVWSCCTESIYTKESVASFSKQTTATASSVQPIPFNSTHSTGEQTNRRRRNHASQIFLRGR